MEPFANLTPDEKRHIEMEEQFRHEIRKSLETGENKPPSSSRIWNFFNSSFGLWFLSTCVVGFITFLYTQNKEQQDAKAKQDLAEIETHRQNASLITLLLPYLASPDDKQWRMAIEITKYLKGNGKLPGELESALEGIVHSAADTSKNAVSQQKIDAAAAVIDIKDNSAPDKKVVASTLPPRVYIQIANDSQMDLAKVLQATLRKENFIAPGVENVGRKGADIPNAIEVRYFRAEEMAEAQRIISIIKSMNMGLRVNESPQLATDNDARPRHYEVWFSNS
ncbi:hypothetical protein QTN47_10775 [Danxiaibacter flavus]|uniref:Uncharacterized protein n=1 Tax=Danxiaibacter flavus TaxID=3049108 RepID=A0ABV3ZDN5_9BACT|nr:hypothetical protein QNM32_10780 [Chitinophagaceae bacterium DXS]